MHLYIYIYICFGARNFGRPVVHWNAQAEDERSDTVFYSRITKLCNRTHKSVAQLNRICRFKVNFIWISLGCVTELTSFLCNH